MNKLKIILLVITIVVCGLAFLYTHFTTSKSNVNSPLEKISFKKENLKLIRKDSFLYIANKVYGNNIIIMDAKNNLNCKVFNQNQTLNEFVNTNLNLLKIKNFGFDITITGRNDTINAKFEKQKIDSVEYINLPTDVIFGITNKHSNK